MAEPIISAVVTIVRTREWYTPLEAARPVYNAPSEAKAPAPGLCRAVASKIVIATPIAQRLASTGIHRYLLTDQTEESKRLDFSSLHPSNSLIACRSCSP